MDVARPDKALTGVGGTGETGLTETSASSSEGMSSLAPSNGTEPLVSILIPAYNAERFIADTIRSAINQTWQRKEIIIVDDGSKDNTVAIARQFASQGVKVVQQKNQGAAAARNTAFSLSQGEYIQWLDADDLLGLDKVAGQMRAFMEGIGNRTLLSSPWGSFMYRPSRARFVSSSLWANLSPREWLLHKLGENVFMQTGTWLVSRELTEAAGPWDTRLLGDDDGEYFCRILLASEGVHFVRGSGVYYRAFGFNSLSYIGRIPKKIEAHWLSMQLHIRYLRSLEDSPRVHTACIQYLRNWMFCFYPERLDIVREAQRLAAEMGGELGVPELSWKYAWIEKLFGWGLAKPVQLRAIKLRWKVAATLDKALYRLESRDGELVLE